MRVSDETGYVLRRLDYGDTSLLVDLFTRDHGRLRVLAKGARSGKSARARSLQLFSRLTLGWSGRSELKTLTQLDLGLSHRLDKEATICGFYLNELLWNFLEVQDPHEALFACYEETLALLAEGKPIEPLLRDFELFLLQDIGYGPSFDLDAGSGEPIDPVLNYVFEPELGLVLSSEEQAGVSGALFLAVANREFTEAPVLALAKQLSRQIINDRLEGQELHSRKWFASLRSARG